MSLFDAAYVARRIEVSGTGLHVLVREHPGKPVLLLLHGYPQTHVIWYKLAPLPERMIGADPESWLRGCLSRWSVGNDQAFSPEAVAEYLRCFSDPDAIRASCDDYRATAGVDLVHDRLDVQRRMACPLLVLWGAKGFVGRNYDVLALWREKARRVEGAAIQCSHFLPEEAPAEVANRLREFVANASGS